MVEAEAGLMARRRRSWVESVEGSDEEGVRRVRRAGAMPVLRKRRVGSIVGSDGERREASSGL